jgi:hypothetical protein
MKKKSEYKAFDDTMTALLKVPHAEIKAKMEAEKTAKKKRKPKASVSGREPRAKD